MKFPHIILFTITILSCSQSKHVSQQDIVDTRKHPDSIDFIKLDSIFSNWIKSSHARTEEELIKMDSTTKIAYDIYEKLFPDTATIGIDPNDSKEKYYFVAPIKLEIVHLKDNSKLNLTENDISRLFLDSNLRKDKINTADTVYITGFRPKVFVQNKPIIYLNQDIVEEIKTLSKTFYLDEYLNTQSNSFFEHDLNAKGTIQTSPCIERITIISNSEDLFVNYRIRDSKTNYIWFKRVDNKIKRVRMISWEGRGIQYH